MNILIGPVIKGGQSQRLRLVDGPSVDLLELKTSRLM